MTTLTWALRRTRKGTIESIPTNQAFDGPEATFGSAERRAGLMYFDERYADVAARA